MIPYFGRCGHAIKAPHKPIKQGFKIWALGDSGYICNWLWYSKKAGTEATNRTNTLAPTQGLVLNLAKSLPQPQNYTLFTDNLFTNCPLALELLQLNIGIMGTARTKALGFPSRLVRLKENKKALAWGTTRAEITEQGKLLCFLWQDNNAVLGINPLSL